MSIRQGILALLADGPQHGYQLRQDFESRTGATWPLNIGQVYTTLARLERDELVTVIGDSATKSSEHKTYTLTGAGRAELHSWFTTPVRREDRPRDELAIKLAMAAASPDIDVRDVIQAQRTDTMRALQDYTRLKTTASEPGAESLAWEMVLDSLIFAAEAEVRWLDACEGRLLRRSPATRSAAPAVPVEAIPAMEVTR